MQGFLKPFSIQVTMKGKIKALRTSFGFINIEGEEKDLFFHQSDVEGGEATFKKLQEGDIVEFEKGSGDKGPRAMKVKKATAVEAPVEAAIEEEKLSKKK